MRQYCCPMRLSVEAVDFENLEAEAETEAVDFEDLEAEAEAFRGPFSFHRSSQLPMRPF